MKTETKTIIISSLTIIFTIFAALFVIYKIDEKKNLDTKPVINTDNIGNYDNIDNNDNQIDSSIENKDNEENKDNNETKNETNESKVIVYLFHGNTCPHCQNAIATLTEKKNTTYKNIQIKTFDVWDKQTDNSALMQKVAEELNVEARYVPFFVIGSSSIESFNEEKILKQIETSTQDKNYEDIVTKVINKNKDLNIVSDEIK